MRVDTIWRNARLMTMQDSIGQDSIGQDSIGQDSIGQNPGTHAGLGIVTNGLLAARDGRIVHVGPAGCAPAMEAETVIDCHGRWITPGLIDCHTHLIFGGDRADEFEARLAGASYADLAAIGGIRATVAATRAASDADLLDGALHRLDAMIAQGVTTVEIKSGYGLDLSTELRQLRIARALPRHRKVHVATSLLAAHALPPEPMEADAYIDRIITDLLPAVRAERLADAVDAFCETIAFSPAQISRLFDAASAAGLPVRLHADQLTDGGGAALAARYRALSADHLEYASADGIAALARAGTVAVLLPGAFYSLRETQRPPIAALRAAGVAMAVATDCNPGSSPLTSPLLAMNMAACLFGMTVAECLRGMTRHAAAALGLTGQAGVLAPGHRADLAIWSIEQPAELVYWIGANPLWRRVFAG
jgi:imidazolonepropionase